MEDIDGVVSYAYEVGHLARSPRAGWQLGFVRDPESVAEHSHRAGVLAYLIAHLEDANPERAATLALFHDVPETRSTDLHSMAKRYTSDTHPEQIAKDQTREMPSGLADAIRRIIADVEAKATPESVCAKDADKLDCLLRAREYQTQGYTHLQPWVDNMAAGMRTETGKALAAKAADPATSPGQWWHETAASYGLPGQPSTGPEHLHRQVMDRVFSSPVELRLIDVDGLAAEITETYGCNADVQAIDEDVWWHLLDSHNTEQQARRGARAEALDHRAETPDPRHSSRRADASDPRQGYRNPPHRT